MMRNTIPLEPNQLPVNVHELQRQAGIKRKVHWVTGYWVKSPVAYGLFRPKIAVPMEMVRNYSERQIRWILLHELAHIKRGDTLVFLFQRLLQSLFFFNPLIWWVNALIDRLREYACDDAALVESQAPPKECGEGFLGVVMQNNGLPTFQYATHGLVNYKTMIRRRLMRILDDKRRLHAKLTLSAMILLFLVSLFVAPFSFKVALAQVSGWELVTDSEVSVRGFNTMVYDSNRGVILLHGGCVGAPQYEVLHDTWEWDGSNWTLVATDGPTRYSHCMAFDSDRGIAVLFGGYNKLNEHADSYTWEWDSNSKTWNRFDTTYMEPRIGFAMVYDSERKRIIMHGGNTGERRLGETWSWDGETWSLLTADGPVRQAHRMVYDSKQQKTVLYGGWAGVPGEFPAESTWQFDGSNWIHIATTVEPPSRVYPGLAFDSSRGITMLFGGGIIGPINKAYGFPETVVYSDTWEWDGTQWTEISTNKPPARMSLAMAYDSLRKKMIMFGGTPDGLAGFNGTWEYTAPSSSGMPKRLWTLY